MQKAYSRIIWENYPSVKTAVNARNLNKVDVATDEIDNRVITLNTTKADQTVVNNTIVSVSVDDKTGIFTFTKVDGSSFTVDTLLEKVAINFDYDPVAQKILIYLEDGTVKEIDVSALITIYEFLDSDTIAFTVQNDGKVTANIKGGSITEDMLRPNYLADIRIVQAQAQLNQEQAELSATEAKSWAVGDTGTREDEAHDNAKYYAMEAKISETNAKTSEENASNLVEQATRKLANIKMELRDDGHLYYELTNDGITFRVNPVNGHLEFTFE